MSPRRMPVFWAVMVCAGACCHAAVCVAATLPTFTPPPRADSAAWFTWYDDLLRARIDHVTFQRDQTRYVSSSSGHDANDGASPATAWSTLARANAWLNSNNPSGETREVLLRRGDVWRESQGIVTNAPGVRIADFGNPQAPRPYATGFTSVFKNDAAGWVQIGDEHVYARLADEPISWLRQGEDEDLDHPLSRQSSLAGVRATKGSWWWSDEWGVLLVHPRDGDDPRTSGTLYEVAHTTGRGFSVAGDRSLVENIRADGFGLDPFKSVTQREAFQSAAAGTDQVLFRNCESYYGSSHVITHYAGPGSSAGSPARTGGVATFIDCVAGFTRFNGSAGETVFNAYASGGKAEVIFHNCVTARGTLPSDDFTGKRSIAAFGHTNGYTRLGLIIVNGHRTLAHAYGSAEPPRFNNVTYAPTLSDVRAFVVGGVFEGGRGAGSTHSGLFIAGHAHLNCHYRYQPEDLGNRALQRLGVDGWWINSTLELDLRHQTGSRIALYNTTTTNNKPRLWNSAVIARNVPDGVLLQIDYKGPASSRQAEALRTIFSLDSLTGMMEVNLAPSDTDMVHENAYWGATPAPNDGAAVVLPAAPPIGAEPDPCSALRLPAGAGALRPELDANGAERGIPVIGPFLPLPLRADLNADWRVDSIDLGLLLGGWGTGYPAGDLNMDGVVNSVDLGILLGGWGGCP